jgi:multidrug resistance efflux pump
METLNNYNITGYKFVTWFFRLLLLFALTITVLLIVLQVNDTVHIREGQVIGTHPQVDYIAPVEAEVLRIKVREGQQVQTGDTLMVLQNPDLVQQQAKTKAEITYLENKLAAGPASALMLRNNYEKQLVVSQEILKKIDNDLHKLNVIATITGTVNFVCNTQKSSTYIDKGEPLATIAPVNDSFYAKVTIAEKDIPYIKTGMPVHLKMDAYKGMKYGTVNGQISYVSESKHDNNFFALVNLPKQSKMQLKAGYSLYGEIVLQRVRLYQYLLKKLF